MAQQLVQEVKTALVQDLGLEVAGDPEVRIRVHPKAEGAPSSTVRSDEVLATESKPAAKTRPGEETEPAEDIVPPPIPSVAPVLPGSEADGQPDRPSEGENDA
jgi:hypothetical protein